MSTLHQLIEILDADKIRAVIEPVNVSRLARLDLFDQINSTNTYLLACAKTGMSSGSVCFAESQSLGRGRLGRVWHSPRGANLYCSVLWRFSEQQTTLSALSLAVAVMLADALQQYGILDVQLKWPNDVWFAGRKLAGILLESLPAEAGLIPVVIGVGLNVRLPSVDVHPETQAWIDVAEITNQSVERNRLAGLLVNALLSGLASFQELGLSGFLERWRRHDILCGKSVLVHTAQDVIPGVVVGISDQGELLLKKNDGVMQLFHCGEVSVRW
jgi:birA, biotin-[acetyl-CoA-carboxylase] ligase region